MTPEDIRDRVMMREASDLPAPDVSQQLADLCDVVAAQAREIEALRQEIKAIREGGRDEIAIAPGLIDSLREYALSYTDDQLRQLAETRSGMGEIFPEDAKREIRRRAALAKVESRIP